MVLVARLLPGLNTLRHTFVLRAEEGVVGVTGVAGVPGVVGVVGIEIDLWYLLLSPSPSSPTNSNKPHFNKVIYVSRVVDQEQNF